VLIVEEYFCMENSNNILVLKYIYLCAIQNYTVSKNIQDVSPVKCGCLVLHTSVEKAIDTLQLHLAPITINTSIARVLQNYGQVSRMFFETVCSTTILYFY